MFLSNIFLKTILSSYNCLFYYMQVFCGCGGSVQWPVSCLGNRIERMDAAQMWNVTYARKLTGLHFTVGIPPN